MGFYSGRDYSTLLMESDEGLEDGVVVDMDDGYSQDLKTIEDNVEPYNVEDVAAAQTGHPNDDEGFDPVEESWNVVYESQYNFDQIMRAVALAECNNAYRGVLTESFDDVKAWFTRVKEAFVKMVKKVAAIVKKWIENVTATFRSNKSFMQKYGSKLGEGLAAVKKTNKKMKGYEFSAKLIDGGMKADVANSVNSAIKDTFGVDMNNGTATVGDGTKTYTGGQYQTNMTRIYTSIANKFGNGAGQASQKECGSIDELRKTLKKKYYGGDGEKKEMWMTVESITAILNKPDNCISNAKKSYKEFEKAMNGYIKSLKKLEQSTSKDYDKNDNNKKDSEPFSNQSNGSARSARLNQIRQAINACQDAASAMQVANSTWLAAMRTYSFQARAYANAYVYALGKGKDDNKTEVQNNSAMLSGVELI